MLFAGDPLLTQAFQVVGRHFLLAGAKSLFDGVFHLAGSDEHAAGTEVQAGGGGFADAVAQLSRHGRQHPVPGAVLVQRHAEGLACQQALEEFGAVSVFPEVLAEAGGNLRQVRQGEQAVGFVLAEAVEQFVVEVFLQPAMVAAGGGRCLAGEVQAHAGAPALGFLPELFAQGAAGLRRQQIHQSLVLLAIERQLGGIQLQEVSGQQQAGQVPGRALAHADQQAQVGQGAGEELVDAVVETGRWVAGVVVQDQPDPFAAMPQQQLHGLGGGQGRDVLLQFAGELGDQLFGRQRLAGEREPYDRAVFGLGAEEFIEQHALAEAGRRAEQAQARVLGCEALDQQWAGHMGWRKARQARRRGVRSLARAWHGAVLAEL
ncbi:hypothetical protein D3C84_263860 [compost metagenome]